MLIIPLRTTARRLYTLEYVGGSQRNYLPEELGADFSENTERWIPGGLEVQKARDPIRDHCKSVLSAIHGQFVRAPGGSLEIDDFRLGDS